ncbi:MAG: hypothetical protein JXA81_03815 [Sedimentisphaerales bacterium]|nr:hypothetical protein [Sedimentisphaerales bacterium]
MAKISKSIVALIAATVCMVLLVGRSIGPTAEVQAGQTAKADEQQQDVCVLVEAFIVEVNLSQLYEHRVSPIGQKPDSVSVGNILDCLKTKDLAQVTTGVKITVNSGQHGETKINETTYIERQLSGRNIPPNVRYASLDTGKTLEATASVQPGGEIYVSFDFKESTYRNIAAAEELPPNTISRKWSGAVRLYAGRPAIAGATQNEETAVFLIISADITGG